MKNVESPSDGRLRQVPAALIVLAVSLLITCALWLAVDHAVRERDRLRFEGAVDEAQLAITLRMDTYTNALRDAVGLFVASGAITRGEWHDYVRALELRRRYPGIQGIGFTERISAPELAAHERRVRAEGFPGYRVWPETPRSEYFSIVYLEPFDWRNQRAFGFDMFTEPTRREAMARARDTGAPALSGRVTLVQETDVSPQAGFLLYVPVYRKGMPSRTVEERRASLEGFVYAPFRADDLFKGIFGRLERNPIIDFEVFDGRRISPDTLLHDHNPLFTSAYGEDATYRPRFQEVKELTIAGHRWTVHFSTLPAFEAESNRALPLVALMVGLLVTGLLVWLTWALGTGRERALALAREMTLELREADKAKDEFLSVISHELRTPLNFIMGFASILEDEVAGPMSRQQHEYMGKILNGVDRMLLLVNDLLDFAKIQAGKFELHRHATPYAPLVEEVVSTMRPLADQKDIAVSSDVAVDVTPTVDGPRVVQVLTNLLSNAVKFTPAGGSIRVTARIDGNDLLTEVTDTGIGISAEDLPKLFTRFRQLDMSSTREAGGTGLGLSISKGIVEAHGGSIGVRSEKGCGSTFWFRLPLG